MHSLSDLLYFSGQEDVVETDGGVPPSGGD